MMGRTTYFLILRSQVLNILEREELIFGDNGIASMSNFSSLAEKQALITRDINSDGI